MKENECVRKWNKLSLKLDCTQIRRLYRDSFLYYPKLICLCCFVLINKLFFHFYKFALFLFFNLTVGLKSLSPFLTVIHNFLKCSIDSNSCLFLICPINLFWDRRIGIFPSIMLFIIVLCRSSGYLNVCLTISIVSFLWCPLYWSFLSQLFWVHLSYYSALFSLFFTCVSSTTSLLLILFSF